MRIIAATVGPIGTGSATAISALSTGTVAGGTALTLTSSPYVLTQAQRITITSTGNDTGINFIIVGLDWNGTKVTETLKGASGSAAQSLYDYTQIISITPSATTTNTVSAGTNSSAPLASTRPIFLDEWAFHPTALQVDVTGAVNMTVQQSLDNPNEITGGYPSVVWINHPDTNLVGLTTSIQGNYGYAPKIVRLVLNSGTGSAIIRVSQSAAVPF